MARTLPDKSGRFQRTCHRAQMNQSAAVSHMLGQEVFGCEGFASRSVEDLVQLVWRDFSRCSAAWRIHQTSEVPSQPIQPSKSYGPNVNSKSICCLPHRQAVIKKNQGFRSFAFAPIATARNYMLQFGSIIRGKRKRYFTAHTNTRIQLMYYIGKLAQIIRLIRI